MINIKYKYKSKKKKVNVQAKGSKLENKKVTKMIKIDETKTYEKVVGF